MFRFILLLCAFSPFFSIANNGSDDIEKYTYRIILFSKGEAKSTASAFFIATNSKTYLVTARHIFYNDDTVRKVRLQTWRGFDGLQIPVPVKNGKGFTFLQMSINATFPILNAVRRSENDYFDLILIEVHIPPRIAINFTDYNTYPTLRLLKKGTPAFIIGFPSDKTGISVVATKILKDVIEKDGRQTSIILTEKDSYPGVSGSPVFIYSSTNKNTRKPVLLGVYTGYTINVVKGKKIERGTVVNGNILRHWRGAD
jgi:V8-like Glu-specific endopeptidase